MLRIAGAIATIVVAIVALWWLSRGILPPETVRFAAGIEGGGYWHIAERYRDILAEDDIDLQLVATEGSVENARLLADHQVDAALLQGGIATRAPLETLGAVLNEPLLVFARSDTPDSVSPNPALWRNLRIGVGSADSGTRAAARSLFQAARLKPADNTLRPLGADQAARALMAGQLNLALFVAPLSAPYLTDLLANDDIRLVSLSHLVTLSRRIPQAIRLDIPSGAFSLNPPRPPADLSVLGLVARIAAQPDLHPAIVDRLVEAARRVHEAGNIITPEARFPTMDNTSLPQDAYARDLIADGPSALNTFLPYWVTAQISRFAILLLPIVFLVLPLLRTLPGLYKWSIRNRVFRYYSRIREIDEEAVETDDPATLNTLNAELADLDREIAHLKVPLTYQGYAYNARLHIDLLRKKIANRMA